MAAHNASRVLVTGGSGFIGTHLVEALARRDAVITNLDVRRPRLDAHAAHWRACNLMDAESVTEAVRLSRPEVVFNLAAQADLSPASEALAVNVTGVANLMEALRRTDNDAYLVQT